MKTLFLFIATCLLLQLRGQTCANLALKKGTKITIERQTFQRDYAAMKVYMKLNKDEQKKADEDFAKDVAEGRVTLPKDELISTIEDVRSEGPTVNYYSGVLIKGVVYHTRMFCYNNILTLAPYSDESVIKTPLPKGDTMYTTSVNGYNKIPLNLKVGDTLTSYQDVSFSSPITYTTSGWVKHYETDVNGDVWKVSNFRTQHIEISSSSVTKYVNREVTEEKDMVLNGKTYKAYKIVSEIWTKTSMKGDASSLGLTIGFATTHKLIDKKTNKTLGTNSEGYLVSSVNNWFVPELGLSLVTDIYDTKGNLFARMTVKDIQ